MDKRPLRSGLAVFLLAGMLSGSALATERTLEFTTEEGTWISLDVSPDSRTIVFDLLGDLYTLPIEGGTARRITAGPGFDSQPRYAPDGASIAYVSDAGGSENLWIAKADGSESRALSRDRERAFASPRWTPDGRNILVARSTGGSGVYEIWMYGLDGGEGKQVTTSGEQRLNFLGAVLSPDNRHLYYARRRGSFSWTPVLPLWQLLRRNQSTGEDEAITARMGSAFSPLLSHDGARLVYGTRLDSETGLRIRDLTSGEERWLKYPIQRDDQEARATRDVIPGYAFTPDDREIVLSYGGRIWRLDVATGAARQVPFQAQVSVGLGPVLRAEARVDDGPVRAHLIQWPRIAPDGRRLTFSALGRLYVSGLDGSRPVRVTEGSDFEFHPAWSPDGTEIAWVTWSSVGGHVWKTRLNGLSAPQRLTRRPAYYHDPVWSPDGARIVAVRGSTRAKLEAPDGLAETEPEDLVTIPAGGGDAEVLAPAQGARWPQLAGTPERLYLSSGQGLQSLAPDGSDRRTLLKVVGKPLAGSTAPTPADEIRVSPDGRQALALVNNQLYLLEIPAGDGEKTPIVDVGAPGVPSGKIRRLTRLGADAFTWSADGRTVVWTLGASLFQQQVLLEDADGTLPAPRESEVIVEVSRDVPSGTVVLRGAQVITMRGDEVLRDADVVVRGNRISAIGRRGETAIPSGAEIVDVRGKHILPGLIDIHEHWNELQVGLVQRDNWPLLTNLAYGVTSTRDPQSRTLDLFLYQDLVETGEILGPRLFTTGPGIFSKTPLDSYQDVLDVVTRYQKYYRTNMIKAYTVGDRQLRQWVIQASKERGVMPTTEGAMDLKLNLTHALDGFSGNEHALPVAPLYKDVVQLFAGAGIDYTPTLVLSYGGPLGENFFYESTEVHEDPKLRRFVPLPVLDARALRRSWYHPREHVFQRLAEGAAAIRRAGGRVCIGGHGQLHGLQAHWEMWALASGGMSNLEVLRAATLSGAEAIGYARDLGSLEPGKLADLIVLDRDPLVDIRNTTSITHVMKNGRLFAADSLDEIWPVRRQMAEAWWSKDDPVRSPRGPDAPAATFPAQP